MKILLFDKEKNVVGEAIVKGGKLEIIRNHRGNRAVNMIVAGEITGEDINPLQEYLHDIGPCFGFDKGFYSKQYVRPENGIEITNFKPKD